MRCIMKAKAILKLFLFAAGFATILFLYELGLQYLHSDGSEVLRMEIRPYQGPHSGESFGT